MTTRADMPSPTTEPAVTPPRATSPVISVDLQNLDIESAQELLDALDDAMGGPPTEGSVLRS